MAVVTDNFNRADGGLGSNWATLTGAGTIRIVSNQAAGPSSSTDSAARYTATAIGADQYSQAIIQSGDNLDSGILCRCSSSAFSCYFASPYASIQTLNKFTNGSFSTLSSGAGSINIGDTLRVEAEGTTIRYKKNGTQVISVTDSSFASGQPGLFFYESLARLDDWEAGDLGGGPTTHNASAALSGTGVMVGAPLAQRFSSVAFSGTGSSQFNGLLQGFISASLGGTGSLQVSALREIHSSATMSGSGTMSSAALVSKPLQVAFSGSGAMQSSALREIPSSASMVGSGLITATALLTAVASAAFSGSGLLAATAEGIVIHFVSATLSGVGDLAASGVRAVNSSAIFAATSAMQATGVAVRFASAVFSGTGNMSARVQSAISRYVRYAFNLLPGGLHRGRLTGR